MQRRETNGKSTAGLLERLGSGSEETRGRGGTSSKKAKAQRRRFGITGRVGARHLRDGVNKEYSAATS